MICWADGSASVHDGKYLSHYDPDHNTGLGKVKTTKSIEEAHKFESAIDAMNEWKRQSTVRPYRLDGKPNRPLTAWSIAVERVNEQT